MSDPRAITRSESTGSWALWIGILAGPLAWSVQLAFGYALEDVIACAPGTSTPGSILGVAVPSWVVLVSAALLLITVAAGALSVRCLRRLRGASTGSRERWMAKAGIINSALFALIIAVAFIPGFTLGACEVTR